MSDLFESAAFTVNKAPEHPIYAPMLPAVAMSCLVTNKHTGTLPITAYIRRGEQTIWLASERRVDSGHNLDVLSGSKVALVPGDEIYATCPLDGAFSGILSAYVEKPE